MSYKAQIIEVVQEFNDRSGSSMVAIKKIIQSDLPKDKKWLNATFLTALKNGVEKNELVKVKAYYKISPDYKKKLAKAAKEAAAPPKKKVTKKKAPVKKTKTSTTKKSSSKTVASKKKSTTKKSTTKKPASKKTVAKKKTTKKSTTKKTTSKKNTSKEVYQENNKEKVKYLRETFSILSVSFITICNVSEVQAHSQRPN
jgi:histone H1/5